MIFPNLQNWKKGEGKREKKEKIRGKRKGGRFAKIKVGFVKLIFCFMFILQNMQGDIMHDVMMMKKGKTNKF